MSIIYKTEEEAEEKAEEINERETKENVFCPLINGPCQKTCQCFVSAYPKKLAEEMWCVLGFHCNNGMFIVPE